MGRSALMVERTPPTELVPSLSEWGDGATIDEWTSGTGNFELAIG